MTRLRTGTIAVLALVLLLGGAGWADEAQEQGEPAVDPGMQAMLEMAAPGEHHNHLAKMVGKWSYTAKMWMPGAPEPIETTGTMEARPLLDGRFVEAVWTGEFMGQPFRGISIDGYDKAKGHYTSVWMDNFGTYTLQYTGQCDGTGKVRTMKGTFTDPMSGEEVRDKGTTTIRDDGSMVMESWRILPDGKEVKMMEIAVSRR